MNLSDGKLVVETGDDPALRKAAITKIVTETVVAVLSLALMADALAGDKIRNWLKRKADQLRRSLFGPPPLSEEQIKSLVRQTEIEAMRIVRDNEH
ncbi:MAG: hypothetical protein KGI89_15745 [Euryarchaeota archaeon]|nr:hypothetical protein [Euryarchaeota archaeon]